MATHEPTENLLLPTDTDYVKLAEKDLDEIMASIREELGLGLRSGHRYRDYTRDIKHMTRLLYQLRAENQVGLHRAPMHNKRGLARVFGRIIEKVYLRVAELTNRDIRKFNSTLINLLQTQKFIIDKMSDELSYLKEQMSKRD